MNTKSKPLVKLSDVVEGLVKTFPGITSRKICNMFKDGGHVMMARAHRMARSGKLCVDKHTQPHAFYHPSYFGYRAPSSVRELMTYLSQFDGSSLYAKVSDNALTVRVNCIIKRGTRS